MQPNKKGEKRNTTNRFAIQDLGGPNSVSKNSYQFETQKRIQNQKLLGRTAFGSPNSIYFSNPKNGHQTNRTVHVTSSCACCGFLRSRLESQSWNSFNPFPIVNRVSAGVPTPPDSGKTPQLKTSKLAQNCGKIEVLHLQPSYGICWSHEIETLPAM